MTIENCAICGQPATLAKDWDDCRYVWTDCSHGVDGPTCDDEETAIRYWNAMQRGLKMEVAK